MSAKWSLILGVVFGLVAAVLAFFKLQSIDEPVVIQGDYYIKLAPGTSLAAGERLRFDSLEAVEIPADFTELHRIAVPYTEDTEAWFSENDVRVSQDVSEGAFLLHQHLIDNPDSRFATVISKKNRAISIPVSQVTSVSYFIQPGSRIDLLSTFTVDQRLEVPENTGFSAQSNANAQPANPQFQGDNARNLVRQQTITRTMLQNLLVLAVGKATTRNAYLNTDGYSTITLDVTPEEAELLTFMMAQSGGGFNFVLRNPGDEDVENINDVNWDVIRDKK